MNKNIFIAAAILLGKAEDASSQTPKPKQEVKRPNIVIILADDMGYSDMGMFGSEIKTPNMDALATNGLQFTNFHTQATSSPSRAMLLTGVDNHICGLGNMDEWTAPNQEGKVGMRETSTIKLLPYPNC